MNGATVHVYSLSKDGNTKVSAHFRVREFACTDGTDTVFLSPRLVEVLESIRVRFNTPVTVSSGYRTEARNKAVGGSAYSRHKYGQAADICVSGVKPDRVAEYAETLLKDCGGIGVYSDFVHIDVRNEKSRWKG